MSLERISAEEMRVQPGAIQELAVRLTDDDGAPIAKKSVTFTVTPPGAVLFNGVQYAAVETDAHGIVSVRALVTDVGRHAVHVKAPPGDRHHKVQFTVVGTSDTEVVPMGNDILVVNGGGDRPVQLPMWPIAAVIGALVLGFLLWDLGSKLISRPVGQTAVVGAAAPAATGSDPYARAQVEALAGRHDRDVGRLDAEVADRVGRDELSGAIGGTLRITDRWDGRTRRVLASHLGNANDGRSLAAICRVDPSLPNCR